MQLLIHGFGTYADYGKFGAHTDPINSGFVAWHQEIINGKATVFNWGITKQFHGAIYFRINSHLDFYREEVALCSDLIILSQLHNLILDIAPSEIICHSTGAQLFLEYCEIYEPNKSIKKITFLQSNISAHKSLPTNLRTPLENHSIILENTYCWYDQTLIVAAIIDREQKAGLVGWKNKLVTNRAVKLSPKNPHQTVLVNRNLSSWK